MTTTNTGRLVEFMGRTYLLNDPGLFMPELVEPAIDTASIMRRLSLLYAATPSEHAIMKPLSPMMEMIEDAKIRERQRREQIEARRTWNRRKRHNRKRPFASAPTTEDHA
jgi:hypothetical protein